jgi:tellurite resistance protein TerC
MSEELILWSTLGAVVIIALALDLLLHREPKPIPFSEASIWVGVYVVLAVAYGGLIWALRGSGDATDYFTGYVIEFSLSMDNVFVFAVIFTSFAIPAHLQHRVLFIGVFSAIVMRFIFIIAGVALLEQFDWVAYVFGAFLVFTGLRFLRDTEHAPDPETSRAMRLFRRVVPASDQFDGQRFFTRVDGRLLATPLLAALFAVETADIVFAVDSVPAILAITRDIFIVFAANAFAILGLRQLYFLLAGLRDRFVYLHYGLAVLLVWVGAKMILAQTSVGKLSPVVSLSVIVSILAISIAASWIKTRNARSEAH